MLMRDTDHLSPLDGSAAACASLSPKVLTDDRAKVIAIAKVDPQMRSWIACFAAARTPAAPMPPNALIQRRVEALAGWKFLPRDERTVAESDRFRPMTRRDSTMDLRIGCNVLANNATAGSRNFRDLRKIPNLHVEGWLQE